MIIFRMHHDEEKRVDLSPVKEAVSGTTLVDETTRGKASYIQRMHP